MSYTRCIDRRHPTCVVFLLDQSAEMGRAIEPNGRTWADVIADLTNRCVMHLVFRASRGDAVLPYLDIAVIGYGETVGPAWDGSLAGRDWVGLPAIADNTLRVLDRTDADGRMSKQPIWFEPVAKGPRPMCEALRRGAEYLTGWHATRARDIFPPIVLNISGGGPTDGSPEEVIKAAESLKSLSTDDGQVLLLNFTVADFSNAPLVYPHSKDVLRGSYADLLFEMSSVIPDVFRGDLPQGSRLLLSKPNDLIDALADSILTWRGLPRPLSRG